MSLTWVQDFDVSRTAHYTATIEPHALRFSASVGLHSVFVANCDAEEIEVDSWSADLDIDQSAQFLTVLFWNLERLFEHGGHRPVEPVTRVHKNRLS